MRDLGLYSRFIYEISTAGTISIVLLRCVQQLTAGRGQLSARRSQIPRYRCENNQ